MIAILFISIFLLFVAFFAVYLTKPSVFSDNSTEFLPTQSRGLFDAPRDSMSKGSDEIHRNLIANRASELRVRAAAGDFAVLRDAHMTGDASFYREILDTLVERSADSPDILRGLSASVIKSEELRSTPLLAERLLESWKQSPTTTSTAELLRVAALSDDAGVFEPIVILVFDFWSAGRLPKLKADDLRALFESEYWMLSAEAKRSGDGFILKEKLAEVRRQLIISAQREVKHSKEVNGQPPASN